MGMENGKPSFVTAGPDVVRSFRSLQRRGSSINRDLPVIDCDLHNRTPSLEMLYPYLPDYWRDHCEESGFFGPDANDYPEGAPTSTRPEITEPSADRPQSDLALLREHALDPWGVQYGILTCAYRVQSVHNEDLAAALASAVNDWQIEHWLDPEPRLRGSLIVPSQNPELAAREIERLGGPSGVCTGDAAGTFTGTLRKSTLPPDLRRCGTPRSGSWHPLRRGTGASTDIRRLALNLSGGIRRYVAGVSGTGAQSGVGRRF